MGTNRYKKFKQLHKNPNPDDLEKAFVSPFPLRVKVSSLKNKTSNWSFSEKDKPLIESIKREKYK